MASVAAQLAVAAVVVLAYARNTPLNGKVVGQTCVSGHRERPVGSDRNRHGLSRDIPDRVKRLVRQECGFGCVVCGLRMVFGGVRIEGDTDSLDVVLPDGKRTLTGCIADGCEIGLAV